jgi:hypothetical protein
LEHTIMKRTSELTWAIEQAIRAPSVHNTQPWRWRIGPDTVELYADWTRHLPWTDPDRRDLVLSCGAALHHLRVALAARQLAATVERFPDNENEALLARVTARSGSGAPEDAALFPAIGRRRTDRRRMSRRPVPPTLIDELSAWARREGADLFRTPSGAPREHLLTALAEAARRQNFTPGYPAELQLWTGRYADSHDGVSADAVVDPLPGLVAASPLRRFPHGTLPQSHYATGSGDPDDAAELLVLTTQLDTPMQWLRVGEATSAVLLAATGMDLATTPLSQGVEVAASRRKITEQVLRQPEYPQIVLRVGWPAEVGPLPETARRSLDLVLTRPR